MTYEGSPGQRFHQQAEAIYNHCTQCHYGKEDYGRAICRYPNHPGNVGGAGTEWALNCDHFYQKEKDMNNTPESAYDNERLVSIYDKQQMAPDQDLIYRLRERARIRRQIPGRKSVQEGKTDRIADLLEEAADALSNVRAV